MASDHLIYVLKINFNQLNSPDMETYILFFTFCNENYFYYFCSLVCCLVLRPATQCKLVNIKSNSKMTEMLEIYDEGFAFSHLRSNTIVIQRKIYSN